jgi:Lipocalin-like domain
MTTTTRDDLRTNLIGGWTLQSYEARSIDGSTVTYPLGAHAQGIIMYTPDGYMSAQLMRSDRLKLGDDDMQPDSLDELAAAASGYLSYSGPYRAPNRDQPAAQLDRWNAIPCCPPTRVCAGAQPASADPHRGPAPKRATRLAPCDHRR